MAKKKQKNLDVNKVAEDNKTVVDLGHGETVVLDEKALENKKAELEELQKNFTEEEMAKKHHDLLLPDFNLFFWNLDNIQNIELTQKKRQGIIRQGDFFNFMSGEKNGHNPLMAARGKAKTIKKHLELLKGICTGFKFVKHELTALGAGYAAPVIKKMKSELLQDQAALEQATQNVLASEGGKKYLDDEIKLIDALDKARRNNDIIEEAKIQGEMRELQDSNLGFANVLKPLRDKTESLRVGIQTLMGRYITPESTRSLCLMLSNFKACLVRSAIADTALDWNRFGESYSFREAIINQISYMAVHYCGIYDPVTGKREAIGALDAFATTTLHLGYTQEEVEQMRYTFNLICSLASKLIAELPNEAWDVYKLTAESFRDETLDFKVARLELEVEEKQDLMISLIDSYQQRDALKVDLIQTMVDAFGQIANATNDSNVLAACTEVIKQSIVAQPALSVYNMHIDQIKEMVKTLAATKDKMSDEQFDLFLTNKAKDMLAERAIANSKNPALIDEVKGNVC